MDTFIKKEDKTKYDMKSAVVRTVGGVVDPTSKHTPGGSGSALPAPPEPPRSRGPVTNNSQGTVSAPPSQPETTSKPVKLGPAITRQQCADDQEE